MSAWSSIFCALPTWRNIWEHQKSWRGLKLCGLKRSLFRLSDIPKASQCSELQDGYSGRTKVAFQILAACLLWRSSTTSFAFSCCYIPQFFILREIEQFWRKTTDERGGGGGLLALIFLAQHLYWICNWAFRNVLPGVQGQQLAKQSSPLIQICAFPSGIWRSPRDNPGLWHHPGGVLSIC